MRFSGRVFKVGRFWAIEVPVLEVVTQGHTRKEAFEMIADAIETLVNKPGFRVRVYKRRDEYFEIDANDQAVLIAFLLKRQRVKNGVTLAEVATRMGAKSHNSYARYEQGLSVPTVEKFAALLAAVSPDKDFVLSESEA